MPPLLEPALPALVPGEDSVFALTVFVLFFLSLLASACISLGFAGLGFTCADVLDAFAKTTFLGVGFGVGFGVAFGFSAGFGAGVALGNSISLFA
jgi:hypothetical protein